MTQIITYGTYVLGLQ